MPEGFPGTADMMSIEILSEENIFDDGFLDLIGGEFTAHEQGLAEWLKNGVDAALACDCPSGAETVFLRFTDGQRSRPPVFECVDFVGMTMEDVETRFKPWGKLSGHGDRPGSYGGYGIGGKFYMRQMFDCSYLITYCRGRVNIFGFDLNRRYGYARGYRNGLMAPEEALRLADIESLVERAGVRDPVVSGKRGFSVFRGLGPKGIGKKIDVLNLCQRLRSHPQAQRPLKSERVCVIHNGAVAIEWLKPRSIPRRPGFEKPWIRKIPGRVWLMERGKRKEVYLSRDSRPPGTLRLFVSGESLVQEGKMASLNRIDFVGKDGVVASYRIGELDLDIPYSESIFGECRLTRLDSDEGCLAKKTRDRLVDSAEARALLGWVGSQVGAFSQMIQRRLSGKR